MLNRTGVIYGKLKYKYVYFKLWLSAMAKIACFVTEWYAIN